MHSDQVDGDTNDRYQDAHANLNGLDVDGHDDQEGADHQKHDGDADGDADRSLHVGPLPSQVQQAGDGQQDEAGLDERGVVDQDVNVSHKQVQQRQKTLRKQKHFFLNIIHLARCGISPGRPNFAFKNLVKMDKNSANLQNIALLPYQTLESKLWNLLDSLVF